MDNAENQVPVQEGMIVKEPAEQAQEVSAEELFENLTREGGEEQAEAPAEEASQEQEEELSPEEAQKKAITDGIQSLWEDGWTGDELKAFSSDKAVREDIAGGKTVRQAATAYMRRQAAGAAQKQTIRKSVPTLRSTATQGAKDADRIAEMSDEEFDRFCERAERAAREGKKVLIR